MKRQPLTFKAQATKTGIKFQYDSCRPVIAKCSKVFANEFMYSLKRGRVICMNQKTACAALVDEREA
jgi:hypothetical protein